MSRSPACFRRLSLILGFVLLIVLVFLGKYFIHRHYLASIPSPEASLSVLTAPLLSSVADTDPSSELGIALKKQLVSSAAIEVLDCTRSGENARVTLCISLPDPLGSPEVYFASLDRELSTLVAGASRSVEIYDTELNYLPAVFDSALLSTLSTFPGESLPLTETTLLLSLHWDGEAWTLESDPSLPQALDYDLLAQTLRSLLLESAEYHPLNYSLPKDAVSGSEPNPDGYHITENPSVIAAILATPLARQLIGEEDLCWSADRSFLPGRSQYLYMDESILVLIWKEEVCGSVGTFSEVFLSDASQLRRKLTNDSYRDYTYDYATILALQANAVLAVGGDYYCHNTVNGIMVWNGELMNYTPDLTDTCYFDSNGDMHLYTISENLSREDVLRLIEEQDIMFSLIWGPALVRDGVEITPSGYTYGEINDRYARSAIGQLGHLHYLTLNVNCESDHPMLITMREAAVAMAEHGCIHAYALDGGQTACTIFQGKLINAIQFGRERLVGDILYFASAVP